MTHKKDEALKLALEALTHCVDAITERGLNGNPEFAEKWGLKLPVDRASEAIAAIKQALAAPVQEPVQTTGETNVELDFYSDATGNGQKRQLVGEMEMGQLMGGGPHKSAGNPDAKGEIAVIRGVDEYGPMFNWYEHWVNFPVGTRLYTTSPAQPATCTWTKSADPHMPDTFDATCGVVWTFTDGGTTENGMRFCPGCGGKVVKGSAA